MLSQVLIHLNKTNLWGLLSELRLNHSMYSKGVENKGHGNSLDVCHGPTNYHNEGTKPYCPQNGDHLLESTMGCSAKMGQLLHSAEWRG